MSSVAIIDYGMGNVRSVRNAVEYCGHKAIITADRTEIADAGHVILPGVGAFGDAMANLRSAGLDGILHDSVYAAGKPLLGICLGMQILARSSSEHTSGEAHRGLGWFDADVTRIEQQNPALKIPHMGWNRLEVKRPHPVLAGLRESDLSFYFVHSYQMRCDEDCDVVAEVPYGTPVTAVVARDNVVATQFHPEKSQDSGIELLAAFLKWNP